MISAPKYSIIVATYNRLEEIKELTDSLVEMAKHPETPSFEWIVVDDGSEDGTDEYLNKQDVGFELRVIKQQNQGPGAARNRGMAEARGDYFLFLDSDCTVPPEYLLEVDRSLKAHQWDAFGGPDTYREDFSPLLKAINYSMTSFIGTGGTRGSKKSVTKFYPRSFNMGISRKVNETIGDMGGLRHGQDMDYSARIYKAGFKVGLIETAYVYHKRRTSLWKFFKQIFNWGVARINLSRMHPELLKPIHLAPTLLLLLAASFIFFSWFTANLELLTCAFIGLGLVALYVLVESFLKYRDIGVSFLSISTFTIQILGYGLGTLYGYLQILLGSHEAEGFTKNYYK